MKRHQHQHQRHYNCLFGCSYVLSSSFNPLLRILWYCCLLHVLIFPATFQIRSGWDDSTMSIITTVARTTSSYFVVESFALQPVLLSKRSRNKPIFRNNFIQQNPRYDSKLARQKFFSIIVNDRQTKVYMNNNDDTSSPIIVFDRFIAKCPASVDSIKLYDQSLITAGDSTNGESSDIWVAIYRSNNNQPSVLIRDEFFQVMRSATTNAINTVDDTTYNKFVSSLEININNKDNYNNDDSDTPIPGNIKQSSIDKPVAVARLRRQQPSNKSHYYVLDCMRCSLKKENMDPNCDGGSEHTEAICTAIDTLLHHYLVTSNKQQQQQQPILEGIIRTKATLVSAPLLEKRGFVEVTELYNDMTTHISSYDQCYECYAQRSVASASSSSKSSASPMSPATRQRSIDIVSLLSRIDRNTEFSKTKSTIINDSGDDRNNDDYDPWAGVKKFI